MQSSPVLKKLGFSKDDRVVIIHTDDIGMCQASIDAFADLVDFGLISSGAVMVHCSGSWRRLPMPGLTPRLTWAST